MFVFFFSFLCGPLSRSSGASAHFARQMNRNINATLLASKREMDKETKLLLLGTGESGKSTFAKQMQILHTSGFSSAERAKFRYIIFNNIIENALSLITGAQKLGIELHEPDAASEVLKYDDFDAEDFLEIHAVIGTVWKDPGIQEAFAQSSKFQLVDNCAYFMERIEQVAQPDYVPSDQDILRARSKTTGILETVFTISPLTFRIVDVGGQRSERKKWIHCFQDVTAIIFCVSLSEYDQRLDEDETTMRMVESLRLFRQIVNSAWFASSDIILFLNKKDLFEEKIQRVPLTEAFKSYTGPNEAEPAAKYIQAQFLAQCDDSKKSIFPHITVATDTSNIATVFTAVRTMLMGKAVSDSGLGELM